MSDHSIFSEGDFQSQRLFTIQNCSVFGMLRHQCLSPGAPFFSWSGATEVILMNSHANFKKGVHVYVAYAKP